MKNIARGHLWTRSESKQWCLTLFLGCLLVYAARIALPICIVSVGKEYGWTKIESGLALSSFFWGYASTQVLGGFLADRFGGAIVLFYSCVLWSVFTLVTPSVFHISFLSGHPMSLVILLRIGTGFTQGFFYPSLASLISSHLKSAEKGKLFGIVTAGAHTGTVFCGYIGSIIMEKYSWHTVFHLIGLVGLAWCVYLHKFAFSDRRFGSETRYLLPVTASQVSLQETPAVPWSILLRKSPFWAAVIAHYAGANAYFTIFSWLPSYFMENYAHSKGWIFNVVPNIAIVITSLTSPFFATTLIEKGYSVTFTRKFMEGVSLFGMAICLSMVSQAEGFSSAVFVFSLALAFRGLHNAGVSVNPQDFAPNHTGTTFGLMNMAAAIPGFVGVYMAGAILHWTGKWSYIFAFTAFQSLIGMVVYIFYATGKQII